MVASALPLLKMEKRSNLKFLSWMAEWILMFPQPKLKAFTKK
jgi:hypothetical protein